MNNVSNSIKYSLYDKTDFLLCNIIKIGKMFLLTFSFCLFNKFIVLNQLVDLESKYTLIFRIMFDQIDLS